MSEKVIKELARLVKERRKITIEINDSISMPGNPPHIEVRCEEQILFMGYNTMVNRCAVCQMIGEILLEMEVKKDG